MDSSSSSINIATILLVGMAALVALSLVTLTVYFFGGRSPLERNALGRIEQARSPVDVLNAEKEFGCIRTLFVVVVVGGLLFGLFLAAPDQMSEAMISFLDAISLALSKLWAAGTVLLQELGVGE